MLIRNKQELKAQLGALQGQIEWTTWAPYVEQAERKHLRPWLGQELLNQLNAYLTSGTTDAALDELLQLLRPAAAYFAQLEALPFLNVRIGEGGVQEAQTSNMTPVRQWSYQSTEMATAANAESALEAALAYLEQHAADYPVWAESPACTLQREQLFSRAAELSKFLNIQGSRRAYLALLPFLERAEELYLEPVLGLGLATALRSRRAAGVATAADAGLVLAMRRAVAQLGLSEAVPELTLSLSSTGLSVVTDTFTIRQRLASSQADVAALGAKAQELGQRYLQAVRDYLEQNAAQLPEYVPLATQSIEVTRPMGLTDQDGPAFWV